MVSRARFLALLLPWLATAQSVPAETPAAIPAGDGPVAVSAAPLPEGLYATFTTTRGEFTAVLYPDLAPLTVANFVGLVEGTIPFEGRPAGQPFYDGLMFHRVVDGFVVQGGDPLGNGEGGPGYAFADEFTPRLKHDTAGTLAMANSGPNTNGSQFYFTLNPVDRLNYKHTVFGRVVRGREVLPSIKQGDVMSQVRIARVGAEAAAYRPDADAFARLRGSAPVIAPRDAALPPLFVEGARLDVPEFYPGWLNDKLHHYACVRGVTIFVRTLPQLEGVSDESSASAAVAGLHAALAGREPRSATLVYSAEEKRWRLWFGDGLFGPLGATPDRMHDVKARILASAVKQIEEGIVRRSIDAAVTELVESIDRGEYPPK